MFLISVYCFDFMATFSVLFSLKRKSGPFTNNFSTLHLQVKIVVIMGKVYTDFVAFYKFPTIILYGLHKNALFSYLNKDQYSSDIWSLICHLLL